MSPGPAASKDSSVKIRGYKEAASQPSFKSVRRVGRYDEWRSLPLSSSYCPDAAGFLPVRL
jgi:hypothetical protein